MHTQNHCRTWVVVKVDYRAHSTAFRRSVWVLALEIFNVFSAVRWSTSCKDSAGYDIVSVGLDLILSACCLQSGETHSETTVLGMMCHCVVCSQVEHLSQGPVMGIDVE